MWCSLNLNVDAVVDELRFVSDRLRSSGDVISPLVLHLKGLAGGPHKPDRPDPCAAEISCEGETWDQPCDQGQRSTPPTSACRQGRLKVSLISLQRLDPAPAEHPGDVVGHGHQSSPDGAEAMGPQQVEARAA